MLRRSRTRKPKARTAKLLVEELGEEVLVYDQRDDRVHCLSSAARQVWRLCDGETPVEQLGSRLNLDSELVARALGELEACGLLDDEATGGVTRREATARFASIGAAAAAAPLIYSIAAPSPALARTFNFCIQINAPCSKGTADKCTAPAVGCASCINDVGPGCQLCVPDCTSCTPGVFATAGTQCATPCTVSTTTPSCTPPS